MVSWIGTHSHVQVYISFMPAIFALYFNTTNLCQISSQSKMHACAVPISKWYLIKNIVPRINYATPGVPWKVTLTMWEIISQVRTCSCRILLHCHSCLHLWCMFSIGWSGMLFTLLWLFTQHGQNIAKWLCSHSTDFRNILKLRGPVVVDKNLCKTGPIIPVSVQVSGFAMAVIKVNESNIYIKSLQNMWKRLQWQMTQQVQHQQFHIFVSHFMLS